MKPLRNLGLRTDLELSRFEALVKDRGDYLVVETPGNPLFYWGNYLIFPAEPKEGDVSEWIELFRKEFAHQPQVQHIALTWDSHEPGVDAPGFEKEQAAILTLAPSALQKPPHFNSAISVRPLSSTRDWESALENQIACRMEGFDEGIYRTFKTTQMARYRRMAESGLGNWWGAFLGSELVADCGLYLFENIGRFQAVGTAPAHRRQGICATMIFEIARQNPKTLVIVAELGSADRAYRSVGFGGTLSQWQLQLRPGND